MGMDGVPIMGTCAGCVLLAKKGGDQAERTGTELLGLMDMSVDRNAFGRQRESFEAPLEIEGLDSPFPGSSSAPRSSPEPGVPARSSAGIRGKRSWPGRTTSWRCRSILN